jgi:hypothetical protein
MSRVLFVIVRINDAIDFAVDEEVFCFHTESIGKNRKTA